MLGLSLVDVTLTCRECGSEFIFTAGEQQFYQSKGLVNQPTRCQPCRQLAKAARQTTNGFGGAGPRPPRQMFDVVCADCGSMTQVPFQPKYDRPVYCSNCFETHRATR
jgi:CxxC-x17-CxxC domain-containing protein